jgi:predicted transcriptional regulator
MLGMKEQARDAPQMRNSCRIARQRACRLTPPPALQRAKFSRTLSHMEVHFTPELEAKLAQSAARHGRNPDELVRQVVARYFDEESRFTDAVRRGEEALQRGEYLTHEQVRERLERFLQP